MRKILIALTATLLIGNAASPSATMQKLVQCQLSHKESVAAMQGRKATGWRGYHDDGTAIFSPAGIRSFGYTATLFEVDTADNDDEYKRVIRTRVSAGYENVRTALLRLNPGRECRTTAETEGSWCILNLPRDPQGFDVYVSLVEVPGATRILCTYEEI